MKISKEQIQKIFSNLEFINKIMDDNVPAAECKKYFTDESVEISENELEEMKKLMVAINQIDPEKIDEKDLADIAGGVGKTKDLTNTIGESKKTDIAFTMATGAQLAAMLGLGVSCAISAATNRGNLAKKLALAALALSGTSAMTGVGWITAHAVKNILNDDSKNESKKVLDDNSKSKK